ncbi:Dual specificity protein phosphatase 4 [Hordeum vulgare]|nr:Dual specificity protein phosphatase 4 [Hordeum vulgare]
MFGCARQPGIVYRTLCDILDGGGGCGSGDDEDDAGRVFVHCCHGVSRSNSLVIAYLMWREGQSFDDAFQFVKAARGIANPNMGFACHSSVPKLGAQDVSVGTSLSLCAAVSGAQNAERALARRP